MAPSQPHRRFISIKGKEQKWKSIHNKGFYDAVLSLRGLFKMGSGAGLEPATFSLWGWQATNCSTPTYKSDNLWFKGAPTTTHGGPQWCLRLELNQRPSGYESDALANWATQANKKYELDHSHPTVLFHTPKPCPSVIFNWWLLEVPTLPFADWESAVLATRRKSHIDIFYFLLYIYYTIFFNKNQ